MDPLDGQGEGRTPLANAARVALFVLSAAGAAAILRFAWHQPLVAAGFLGAALALAASRYLAQRRLRKLMLSGDVPSILERWSSSLQRVPYPATMAPLMTATAFAAYGWIDQARAAIAAAERGPAWEAAIEHRLFLDALLLAFEGDTEGSLEQARRLERLPAPSTRSSAARSLLLRGGASALARAFAHASQPGDREILDRASESSPLVYWAMRYASAIVAVDSGDKGRARALLAGAPNWPEESRFRAFHDEIAAHAA